MLHGTTKKLRPTQEEPKWRLQNWKFMEEKQASHYLHFTSQYSTDHWPIKLWRWTRKKWDRRRTVSGSHAHPSPLIEFSRPAFSHSIELTIVELKIIPKTLAGHEHHECCPTCLGSPRCLPKYTTNASGDVHEGQLCLCHVKSLVLWIYHWCVSFHFWFNFH